ncbi:MAG: tRNA lysidine(34) synthetase TilS [Terracidiphilus sp.]
MQRPLSPVWARVHYHPLVQSKPTLPLDTTLLKPGMRIAVGLSGGADSVALLCGLVDRSRELGIVVHAAHLHHGLRGAEADADLEFCRDLAARFDLPFNESRVDTEAEARRVPQARGAELADALPADSIEGTARRLRYAWFRQLLSKSLPDAVALDAVATAHTLDDQAETVLAKFLRGAWTEGLSGIHPRLEYPEGAILRPLLRTTRAEIEAFLHARNQPWREDSTNRHLTFTRNRIRHELLPRLSTWNPQLRDHLAQMAELARDEEAWWQSEVARLASQVILRGRPVRGGGRATTTADGVALDIGRLKAEPVALQRRLLRFAAAQLESALDYGATEALRSLTLIGRAGQKLEFAGGLRADRTHREIRLTRTPKPASGDAPSKVERYECVIPGEVIAPGFGCRISLEPATGSRASASSGGSGMKAVVRSWKPGDRVRLRYSSGPRKVKEVLERMKVTGDDRACWPVVEVAGRIIWMRGVELEPDPEVRVSVSGLPPVSA